MEDYKPGGASVTAGVGVSEGTVTKTFETRHLAGAIRPYRAPAHPARSEPFNLRGRQSPGGASARALDFRREPDGQGHAARRGPLDEAGEVTLCRGVVALAHRDLPEDELPVTLAARRSFELISQLRRGCPPHRRHRGDLRASASCAR